MRQSNETQDKFSVEASRIDSLKGQSKHDTIFQGESTLREQESHETLPENGVPKLKLRFSSPKKYECSMH